jgi:hypothetical protein
MFNHAIRRHRWLPKYLSSDNDPLWAHNPKVGGSNPPPATNELIDSKQVKREPRNRLPSLLLKLSVYCPYSQSVRVVSLHCGRHRHKLGFLNGALEVVPGELLRGEPVLPISVLRKWAESHLRDAPGGSETIGSAKRAATKKANTG